ncbi:Tyrosine-protein kinase transmembrane receptor Ror [Holothuria leucospilota]|uniref:Tyrosine-protein kinase transmembrane receptor Ror n=1 Tax=Holothuria leucospilota TaxID=206669 RepID=A0A9Q1H4L1_HOLLE|nr:Tyrosine-protein kinase transmembrane receptor Ror [Holothuria leucospilota]
MVLEAGSTTGDTISLEFEEGEDVRLNFTVTYTYFGVLQLKRNNSEIYANDGRQETKRKPISLDLSSDSVTFTLGDVNISDSGIYQCFLIGLVKTPVYNVKVFSSVKFIGISKNLERWEPLSVNETIFIIENETLNLTCRAGGGLQGYCSMRWFIRNTAETFYSQDILTCDKHQGESLLTINTVSVDLNNSMIQCVAGGLQASIILRIKRKPSITYSENILKESSRNELTCLLNDSSEQPVFQWSIDGDNVTENATQKRVKNAAGHFIWASTLSFYPSRQHFAKLLSCTITDDEVRTDNITLKIHFQATITKMFSTPSQYVEVGDDVNITCNVTGFPTVEIFWLKDCDRSGCLSVHQKPPVRDLSEVTFSSTIALREIAKTEAGRYTCRAVNDVGPVAENSITIHLEEFGIIGGQTLDILGNQMVNISCLVKPVHTTTYIRWRINHDIDVTSNASQHKELNDRGEVVFRSTLAFHPNKRYNGFNLSCKWGSQRRYSDAILLNISHPTQDDAHDGFSTVIKENFIVIPMSFLFALIMVVAIIVSFRWRRRQTQRRMFHTESPKGTGIHTTGQVNEDLPPQTTTSSFVLYEDVACYTTYVPTSECSGNRLSRHFATGDGLITPEEEEDDSHLQTYSTKDIKLEHEYAQRRERILFKKEISMVKNLAHHPNIVEVLGVCCNSRPNCIILETIPVGNLKKVLLQDSKIEQQSETAEKLRQYVEQICSGMVFLYTNEYFHPYLTCTKVAVDDKGTCKLYDYVPVEIFSAQEDDNQKDVLRNGHVAPEIIQGKRHTYYTEVWVFGILLCEIYHYGLNYIDEGNKTGMQGSSFCFDIQEKPVSYFPEEMYNLMLMCRREDPSSRPSFSSLLDDIKGMRNKTTVGCVIGFL